MTDRKIIKLHFELENRLKLMSEDFYSIVKENTELKELISRVGEHCASPIDCGCRKEIDEYFKNQKEIK